MRQGLTDAVDLVVSLALRKGQQFGFQLRQQRRSLGEKHQTRLEFRLVDIKPADLVALDWDEPHGSVEIDALKLLRERSPGGGILNQYGAGDASSPARSRLPSGEDIRSGRG